MNASEIEGLDKAVEEEIGTDLAGIGVFTLDGMMYDDGEKPRYWY